MKTVIIKRVAYTHYGTFGVMIIDGLPKYVTLEDPWMDNERNVSCIPIGVYKAKVVKSPSKGLKVWELQNVPDRTHIQIHIGNSQFDTDGCILIGSSFSSASPVIAKSWIAFTSFMHSLAKHDKLEVIVV